MKKLFELKVAANVALIVMVIGGLVFAFGFGWSLFIARHEIETEVGKTVQASLSDLETYVDGQLQRVEDAAYAISSRNFGHTVRREDGKAHVEIDVKTFVRPTPDECYDLMEQYLELMPHIYGIVLCFEPYVYQDYFPEGYFSPHVARADTGYQRINLSAKRDIRHWQWYRAAAESGEACWSDPFRDTRTGHVLACYAVPVYGYGGRLVGVLAIDIDTEAFGRKCSELSLANDAEFTLVDNHLRFIYHPDTSCVLRTVTELDQYSNVEVDDSMMKMMDGASEGCFTVNHGREDEALFFFCGIPRTQWELGVQCPKSLIFSGVDRMKVHTTYIALVSILLMMVCFIFLARHLMHVTHSKANMESELRIASALQLGMLPKLYPAFPGRSDIDIYGLLKPAKTVGGDLYDYFIRDEKLFFCIGDVSGKGVPASLFMTVIRALFRNVSLHVDDPAEILSSLNTALSEGNDHNMFCTMFLGVLNLKTGHLDYCNAGHNAPVVRNINPDGSLNVHFMKPQINLAVGVFDGFPYIKEEVDVKPGEAIFLYTDGVTEAENTQKELFGEDATLKALSDARRGHAQTAKEFVDEVYHAVHVYTQGAEQSDDITMVVVEYKGQQPS